MDEANGNELKKANAFDRMGFDRVRKLPETLPDNVEGVALVDDDGDTLHLVRDRSKTETVVVPHTAANPVLETNNYLRGRPMDGGSSYQLAGKTANGDRVLIRTLGKKQ